MPMPPTEKKKRNIRHSIRVRTENKSKKGQVFVQRKCRNGWILFKMIENLSGKF